jgi:hypothetical protein
MKKILIVILSIICIQINAQTYQKIKVNQIDTKDSAQINLLKPLKFLDGSIQETAGGVETDPFYANDSAYINKIIRRAYGYPTVALKNIGVGGDSIFKYVTTGQLNTGIGYLSLNKVTSGTANSCVGYSAGSKLTTGTQNIFFGYAAGTSLTEGDKNTIIGTSSGAALQDGDYNLYIGYRAGFSNVSGNNNIAIGYRPLYSSLGSYSIAIGDSAGYNYNLSNRLYFGNETDSLRIAIYGNGLTRKMWLNYQTNLAQNSTINNLSIASTQDISDSIDNFVKKNAIPQYSSILANNSTDSISIGDMSYNRTIDIKYIIQRGTDYRYGTFKVLNTGTSILFDPGDYFPATDIGVTLNGAYQSGSSNIIKLKWTTTDTGTAATFIYDVTRQNY